MENPFVISKPNYGLGDWKDSFDVIATIILWYLSIATIIKVKFMFVFKYKMTR